MGMGLSIWQSRIGLKPLAALCRRVAISTEAGIDIRRIWQREAQSDSWTTRRYCRLISESVEQGDSLSAALARTGAYFPPLFREMVDVGEKTGTLSETLRKLAEHYEHRLKVRRVFLASILGPMLQLSAALLVVGLLIWIMGFIASRNGGEPIDLLGLGLYGTQGVAIYFTWLATIGAALGLLILAVQRGLAWTKPVQHLLLRVPVIGGCLRTIALARMAWTLHLTMNVEMDLRTVLPICLRSTGNDYYARLSDPVVADVMAGREIHEALRRTRAFPEEFLEVLEVGELSGSLVESMGRLSDQYEERARAAVATLSMLGGFAVWGAVALLIILLIVRLFSFYLGVLNDALKM